MKQALIVVGLLWIAMLATPCYGADGNELFVECSGLLSTAEIPENFAFGVKSGHCLGLIEGIMNMNNIYRGRSAKDAFFCPPSGDYYDVKQAVKIVVNYLNDRPGELHQKASLLVLMAFQRAFPCK